MRIRLSHVAAAAVVLVLVVACSDQPTATAPVNRSTPSTMANSRDDRAFSTNAITTGNAKPTDQVGFTKVFSVQSAAAHILAGVTFPTTATAVCPAGSVAVGGGYGMYLNGDNMRVLNSRASADNGWSVTIETVSPNNYSTFDVNVMCIQ